VWNIKLSRRFFRINWRESDHTLKRETVLDGMIYNCEKLQKFWSSGSICFKGPNRAIQHRIQTSFCRFYLTLSNFGNVITSWILGVSLCMSNRSSHNVCRSPWSTPGPKLISGRFAINLYDHNLVKSGLTQTRRNNSKSVET
jgi:hypothetical protein